MCMYLFHLNSVKVLYLYILYFSESPWKDIGSFAAYVWPQQVFDETEPGFSQMYYFVEHAAGAVVPLAP